ncbi:hypothetical protein CHS0354_027301 [Potamilus streckersoni]|uniref:Mitochondrial fission 1 protein n=1 Tax=Potamilus streckersoni TaxID=2493646 RepID=A0AAE0T8I3_9BIVA|nr:hypothetical protein CHS0354_027301 [Potamilus streckersoni]
METIINDVVDPSDIKKFELIYLDQERRGPVSEKTQFEYAWCLVRSRYLDDMKRGVALLEDLFQKSRPDDSSRRDYLFYLAIGYTKTKEYETALKYVKALLKIEPENHQAKELQKLIKDKLKKEGFVGMAIVGGATLAVVGGLVGLGIALARKSP